MNRLANRLIGKVVCTTLGPFSSGVDIHVLVKSMRTRWSHLNLLPLVLHVLASGTWRRRLLCLPMLTSREVLRTHRRCMSRRNASSRSVELVERFSSSNASWLTENAEQWGSLQNRPRVTTLTHHYYFGGPATNPGVNIPNLLKPATMQNVQNTASVATVAANKVDAGVRMTEGNTCYRGGKLGVSDVFAAALWAADYALLLASNHYSGVNLHGGTGKSVANSVGGSLPGDALLAAKGETPDQIAAHPHPFYTPIATFGSEYILEPVAYGLKFAGSFSGGTLIKTDFSAKLQQAGVNATCYVAKLADGKISVIILNKDALGDVEVELWWRDHGRSAYRNATCPGTR